MLESSADQSISTNGNTMKRLFSLMLVAFLVLGSLNAEAARRLGGGKSVGQQSSNVTQRNAAPAAPTQAAPAAAPKPATPAAPAAAPKKPWGAMLGGLAAGLGLAWLASSLGMGGALGQIPAVRASGSGGDDGDRHGHARALQVVHRLFGRAAGL
jgi:pyruvate/2-oxoglutarate dehydrogenase complex dihydrolipoamide acyltransferase (E2) component